MNTDTPCYRLFQQRPATVFELAGLPVPANPASRFGGAAFLGGTDRL